MWLMIKLKDGAHKNFKRAAYVVFISFQNLRSQTNVSLMWLVNVDIFHNPADKNLSRCLSFRLSILYYHLFLSINKN